MCFLIPFIKVLQLSCDNFLSWERILHTVDYPISETTKRSSLSEDPTHHSIGVYRSNVNHFVFNILLYSYCIIFIDFCQQLFKKIFNYFHYGRNSSQRQDVGFSSDFFIAYFSFNYIYSFRNL